MFIIYVLLSKRGGEVGWGTALQAGKVTGSILDGVIGIFHWHNPSGRIVALEMTQTVTDMSAKNISWGGGKGGRCLRLTNLPPSCAESLEIWEPEPPGNLRECPDL